MRSYRPDWDLSTIPDSVFKSEWARRNAEKSAAKRARTDVDEKTRKRLDQVKTAMRRMRERNKKEAGK